ncbi:hypothetical protein L204_106410 [Cryptococcus depauperatus]
MYCREWGPARFQQYKIKTNKQEGNSPYTTFRANSCIHLCRNLHCYCKCSPPSNLEDIFAARPVLHDQLLDTSELLGEDYGFVGVGRGDGKKEGDYRMMLMIRSTFTWVVSETNARRANWYIPYTLTMTNLDFVPERKAADS